MLIRFYFVCRLLFLAFFSELFGFFLCLVCGVLSLKSFNLGVSCLFSLCLTLFCLVIESLYLTEMLIVLLLIYKAFGVKIRLCGTVKVCVPIHFLLRHIARLLALACSLFDICTKHLNLFAVACLFGVAKLGIKCLESVVASVLLVKVLLKHGEVKALKLNGRVAVILLYGLIS